MPGEGVFGRHQGVVWRSVDGRAWTAEADAAFQFVTPEEIVALGDSLYVFGTIAMCDALLADECMEPPESGWAVWRSTAGAAWERLPQLSQMQFGIVDGVACDRYGRLVAFGSTGDEALAIVWTSVDGANWSATTELGAMTQVTAASGSPAGLVAVRQPVLGRDRGSRARRRQSQRTGCTFTRAATPRLVGTTIRSIARGIGGLVGVGETETGDLQLNAVALQSADGASLERDRGRRRQFRQQRRELRPRGAQLDTWPLASCRSRTPSARRRAPRGCRPTVCNGGRWRHSVEISPAWTRRPRAARGSSLSP